MTSSCLPTPKMISVSTHNSKKLIQLRFSVAFQTVLTNQNLKISGKREYKTEVRAVLLRHETNFFLNHIISNINCCILCFFLSFLKMKHRKS